MDNKCLHMALGDRWFIEFIAKPNRMYDTPVVTNAEYALIDLKSNTVESSGSCIVEGALIKALIEPKQQGYYKLKISADIPPEKIGASADIHVV